MWEVNSGKLVSELKGHSSDINFFSFSPNGNKIITTSKDERVKIWEVKTGKMLLTIDTYTGDVSYSDTTINEMENLLSYSKGKHHEPQEAIFSPDGKHL